MKLKLDENIGHRGHELLTAFGHDVSTVRDHNLSGATDERLFSICVAEGRALVTLDRDFGQVLRFPPENSAGIAIIEIGPTVSSVALLGRLRELSVLLETQSIAGKLWVVEPGRVRIHLRDEE